MSELCALKNVVFGFVSPNVGNTGNTESVAYPVQPSMQCMRSFVQQSSADKGLFVLLHRQPQTNQCFFLFFLIARVLWYGRQRYRFSCALDSGVCVDWLACPCHLR